MDNFIDDSSLDRKSRATMFEISVMNFLKRLEFNDVDGTDSFKIGPNQIDAVGGHEETLLIVECAMKQSLKGEKSLRTKIDQIRGKIENIEKNSRSNPEYRKYNTFRYILAVNFDVNQVDIQYANNGHKISVWDDKFFDYYEDLYLKLGEFAKFNLLGELNVKPLTENKIQIPCSMTKLNDVEMYLFFVNPKVLLETSYVARRTFREERFYQRIIKKDRVNKISRYLNAGHILPNNIIIAFGDHIKDSVQFHSLSPKKLSLDFKLQLNAYNVNFGILEFPKDYRSCWIIDGQHRLYSFITVEKYINVPVVAFKNLSLERQSEIFLDINKYQKPVPPDLVWDLNGDMIPLEDDGIISNVVKALNDEQGSPLFHRINIPSKGIRSSKGLFKIAGLCLAIKKMKLVSSNTFHATRNPLYLEDRQMFQVKLAKALILYFICLIEILKDHWSLGEKGFLATDGGLALSIRLFEKILSRCKEASSISKCNYEKYIIPLKEYFSDKTDEHLKILRSRISSEGGRDLWMREIFSYIGKKINDRDFISATNEYDAPEMRKFEGKLKEYIKSKLLKTGEDWLKNVIPVEKYAKLQNMLKSKNITSIDKLYLQMTLGECFQIIRTRKDIFYADFTEGRAFKNSTDFEHAMNIISDMRNDGIIHFTGVNIESDEEKFFEIFFRKFNIRLDELLGTDEDDD